MTEAQCIDVLGTVGTELGNLASRLAAVRNQLQSGIDINGAIMQIAAVEDRLRSVASVPHDPVPGGIIPYDQPLPASENQTVPWDDDENGPD